MGWYKPGNGEKPIPLTEFAPDKSVLEPGILLDAVGAQPTLSGFSPLPNLVGLAPALAGRPMGTYYAYYSNESATLFAAIDNGAGESWFALDTATVSWVPLTGPTVNPAQPVRFAQFGDDVLAVGNYASPDGVWIAPNKASNFVTIPGSPPNATVIVVAGLQVVVFVQANWFSSAAGNDTDWTLSLATRADTGVLADAPGPVVAAVPLFRNIVAFKKNVTYLGQQSFPSAWDWQLISTQTGTWSQGCVIQLPDAVAFLGMDDFYITTGYTPQRIPNNVKEWFFRNVNNAYITSTLGWYDEGNSTLYWHFVSSEAPFPPTCDRFVSYNIRAKRWCNGRLDVSSVPYLAMAATSIPNPGVPSINIDGDFVPKAFTTFPSNMVLTTGYYGEPGRLSQLMRVLPLYNRYPCQQTLTPLCTDVLGQPDKQSEPAALGVDGWFYTRQYERYHKLVFGMQGDCEITAIVPEIRRGGIWGYGVDVLCPEVIVGVSSQFNPTAPSGDNAAPELTARGTGPGPQTILVSAPNLTSDGLIRTPTSMQCGFTCPLGQFAQAAYNGSGFNSGPAIRVKDTSTTSSYFGLVALYVPAQTAIAMVLYQGEPLSGVGTVLNAVTQALNVGDVLRIEADTTIDTFYRIKINGVELFNQSIADASLSVVNSCIDFPIIISVPDPIVPPTPEAAMIAIQASNLNKTDNSLVDTDLTLALDANSTYVGHAGMAIESASSVPDANLQMNVPASATAFLIDPAWNYNTFAGGAPIFIAVNSGLGTPSVVHWDITINTGATAGNVTIQFAQAVTNATQTQFKANNHLMLFKKV